MSNGRIIRLVPLERAWVSGFPDDATFPPSNLADPQPKVAYRVAATGGADMLYAITVDLQADTVIDTIALIAHSAPDTVTWAVAATTAAQGAGPLGSGPTVVFGYDTMRLGAATGAPPLHAVASFTPVARRYVSIYLLARAGTPAFTIGVLAVGQAIPLDPRFNFDLGSGRRIDDLSDVRQLPGGEFGIWRKARVPLFRATWSQLTDAELRDVWALLSEIGTSAPLLLIEDPDATAGLQERIHYGVLDSLDFDERTQEDKSKIDLRIRAWL